VTTTVPEPTAHRSGHTDPTALVSTPGTEAAEPHPSRGFAHDVWVIARRGLLHMRRQPEQLTDATIQPVMFVVMFAFVFGGAIAVPGAAPGVKPTTARYREFLIGGIMAQTIIFTAFGAALSIANDRKNQAIDRFRSLPIAQGAVLGGHAVANICKALLPITIMSITGLAIGWRIRGSLVDTVAAYGLMIGFAFAMIWVGVLIGSTVSTPEGVNGLAFVTLFPLTFVASTFVPVDQMPSAVRVFARWNPVTTLADGLRSLFGNPRSPVAPGDPWSTGHPVAYTAIWIVAIVVICAPLAVRAYQRSTAS
jgi:ABC-2 type transport system permease protein